MNTAKKPAVQHNSESYSPKDKPVILSMAEEMNYMNLSSEIFIQEINEFCSIVDRPEMKIVGIKVDLNPHCDYNAIDIVKRYIKDGTCKLLEDTVGNKNSGHYIAAVCDIKTGIEFTYIIGVEVDSFDNLPGYLPPNTVKFTCPAARYGKVIRDANNKDDKHPDPKQAICYLASSEFRNKSGYAFNKNANPFRVFDSSCEMITAYEPVKIPQNEEEKFEQVGYEIIILPEIKVIGCTGNGDSCMWNLFEVENQIDWKAAGCISTKQYFSFGCKGKNGNDSNIFGRQVSDFNNVPDFLICATMKSGLWVKFYQMQINNDDPSIFFEGAKEVVFFNKHPEFEEDYSERGGLYVAQYEQGACFYFPIKLKGRVI